MKKLLVTLLILTTSPSHAFDIYTVDDYPNTMEISGQIKLEDVEYFKDSLNALNKSGPPINWVVLNSSGGSIYAAEQMATIIRALSLKTMVGIERECLSACVLLFAAGQERYMWEGGKIGVHGANNGPDSNYSEAPDGTINMAKQLHSYGAPPSVIAAMVITPTAEMNYLTREQVTESNWVKIIDPASPSNNVPKQPKFELAARPNNPATDPTDSTDPAIDYTNPLSMVCHSKLQNTDYTVRWETGEMSIGGSRYPVSTYRLLTAAKSSHNSWIVEGTMYSTKYKVKFGRKQYIEYTQNGRKVKDNCK